MAARPVKIAFLSDTDDLRRGLSQAEASMQSAAAEARTMGDRVDSAFNGTAAAADGVASASSQTAGGLGDLAGALEATGLISEGTAKSMETASAAIMGATGAADLLNVATEKVPGLSKVATKATNILAAAKRGLGLAIRFALGPVGLIIAGIALLVGGMILLYKKNETFRNLVNKVWAGIKVAVGAVVTFFTSKVIPTVVSLATNFRDRFGAIRDAVGDAAGWIKDKFTSVIDFFRDLPGRITSATSGMWDGIKNSFKAAINSVIGWWNNLSFYMDLPDKIPGLPDEISISTPNIPYLAKGGIVTRPTLAVVGEAGPEAVIPLGRGGYGQRVFQLVIQGPVLGTREAVGKYVREALDEYEASGGGAWA